MPDSDDDDKRSSGDDEWEVEKITGRRYKPKTGELQYRVGWKGTRVINWLTMDRLTGCKELIKQFEKSLEGKPRTPDIVDSKRREEEKKNYKEEVVSSTTEESEDDTPKTSMVGTNPLDSRKWATGKVTAKGRKPVKKRQRADSEEDEKSEESDGFRDKYSEKLINPDAFPRGPKRGPYKKKNEEEAYKPSKSRGPPNKRGRKDSESEEDESYSRKSPRKAQNKKAAKDSSDEDEKKEDSDEEETRGGRSSTRKSLRKSGNAKKTRDSSDEEDEKKSDSDEDEVKKSPSKNQKKKVESSEDEEMESDSDGEKKEEESKQNKPATPKSPRKSLQKPVRSKKADTPDDGSVTGALETSDARRSGQMQREGRTRTAKKIESSSRHQPTRSRSSGKKNSNFDDKPDEEESEKESDGEEEEDVSGEEEEFEVEAVIGKKKTRKGNEYLLKWKGYPRDESTWTLEKDCGCTELIEEYERNLQGTSASTATKVRSAARRVKATEVKKEASSDDEESSSWRKGKRGRRAESTGSEERAIAREAARSRSSSVSDAIAQVEKEELRSAIKESKAMARDEGLIDLSDDNSSDVPVDITPRRARANKAKAAKKSDTNGDVINLSDSDSYVPEDVTPRKGRSAKASKKSGYTDDEEEEEEEPPRRTSSRSAKTNVSRRRIFDSAEDDEEEDATPRRAPRSAAVFDEDDEEPTSSTFARAKEEEKKRKEEEKRKREEARVAPKNPSGLTLDEVLASLTDIPSLPRNGTLVDHAALASAVRMFEADELPGIKVWTEKNYSTLTTFSDEGTGSIEKFRGRPVDRVVGYIFHPKDPFVLVRVNKKKGESTLEPTVAIQAVHSTLASRLLPNAFTAYMNAVAQLALSSVKKSFASPKKDTKKSQDSDDDEHSPKRGSPRKTVAADEDEDEPSEEPTPRRGGRGRKDIEDETPKTGRGRPKRKASSDEEDEDEDEPVEESTPRRGGRSRKSVVENESAKKGRGRLARKSAAAEEDEEDEDESVKEHPTRGRRSDRTDSTKKGRGKPARKSAVVHTDDEEDDEEEEDEYEPRAKKGRGRPTRKSAQTPASDDEEDEEEEEAEPVTRSSPRKSGPSGSPEKGRGRPMKSLSAHKDSPSTPSTSTRPKRGAKDDETPTIDRKRRNRGM